MSLDMHPTHMHVKGAYAGSALAWSRCIAANAVMEKKPRRQTFLREWRREKPGRTLEVVAHELHMSQPQLGRIERGDQPYNQDLLEALADLYGCSVADLLMRDPTQTGSIWTIWDQAAPGQRRAIVATAEALLKSAA